ncbi:MAG: hypothetical protein ACOVQQ_07100 [Flavobacterium sp.]
MKNYTEVIMKFKENIFENNVKPANVMHAELFSNIKIFQVKMVL